MKSNWLVTTVTSLRSRFRDSRGVSALEFALVAPVLFTFLLGIVDLGLGFRALMAVTQAAQAGSYYGLLNGFNASAIQNAVANSTATSGISSTPTPSQSCGCPTGTSVAPTSCGSTCSNGQTPGTYVSVSAQYQYSTILAYPGLSSPLTLNSTSMVRIK